MQLRSSGQPGATTRDLLLVLASDPSAHRAAVGEPWHRWPRLEVTLAAAEDAIAWQRANRQVVRRLSEMGIPAGATLHVLFGGPPAAAVDLGVRLVGWLVQVLPGDADDAMPPSEGPISVRDAREGLRLGLLLGPSAVGRDAVGPDGVALRLGDVVPSGERRADPWRDRLAEADGLAGRGLTAEALSLVRDLALGASGARAAQIARRCVQWGAFAEAEDIVEAALNLSPDDPALLEAGAHIAQRFGRMGAFLDRLLRAAAANNDATLYARAAEQLLKALDHAGADVAVRAGLRCAPDHPALLGMAADLAVDRLAPDARERIWAADRGEFATVDRLVRLGALDEAAAYDLQGADGAAWRARLASWRGDRATAVPNAHAALALEPGHPAALVVLAWDALRGGAAAAALDHLAAAEPGLRPGGMIGLDELLSWRSLAHRALGNQRRAAEVAPTAIHAATRTNLSAEMERVLAITRPDSDDPLDPVAWRILAERVAVLVPDLPPIDGQIQSVRRTFETALARLSGNRSMASTWVDARGGLHRLHAVDHPRRRGRTLQMLIRHLPLDQILPRFDALDAELPREPVTRTYRGELLLWLGHYAEAAAAFEEALRLSVLTTWAWIGLGATQWLSGDADAALQTWARGVEAVDFEGPTLFVYRGELLRQAGAHAEARLELDLALLASRRRVSSWIVRALLASDEGDDRPVQVVADAVRAQIPGLWLDACRSAGRSWSTADAAVVLEAALRLMRGNRSSSVPMWQLEGQPLSTGVFNPPCPPAELFPSVLEAPRRNTDQHRGRIARR